MGLKDFICSGITFCPSGASAKVSDMIDELTKNEVKELLQCMFDNFREQLGESQKTQNHYIVLSFFTIR
jgi:hypothetical protein